MKFAGSKRRISLKKIITSRTIALHDYNAKVTIQNAMRMFYAKRSHVDGINFEFIILFFYCLLYAKINLLYLSCRDKLLQ